MAGELSPLIQSLLKRRGFDDPAAAAAFLAPDYEAHTHDPMLMPGMDAAIRRTFAALEAGEHIAVYADFDCDGIPGAALLSDLFAKIGYDRVEVYLPHRDREGYGFHGDAIRELAARGITLIITVDVGTTSVASVALAKELGVDVIVTDHHEITAALPEAIAVLNPKRAPYPFAHLCGAGVAFKFAQALLRVGRDAGIERFTAVAPGWEKWLLDLVAIATVADMVPLTGENRALTYWGIAVLRKSSRPGVAALCTKLRLRRSDLTEEDIAFSFAPRINAASRMDEPQLALRLLTTRDRAEAEAIAAKLETLNASRKGVVAGVVREAKKRASERFAADDEVIVLGDPEWKPALLGLAANSVMEARGGVVCLWGRDALGRIKGSCRSDGALSVVELFGGAADSFEEFGGHAASGGFTVAENAIHTLPEALKSAAHSIARASAAPAPDYDAEAALREVSIALWRDLARLAPFGIGNPKPIFRLPRVQIDSSRRFGKEKNHIEVSLVCPDSGVRVRAYDFFRGPEDFTHAPEAGRGGSVIATIERDSFRGGVAVRLVDILPA